MCHSRVLEVLPCRFVFLGVVGVLRSYIFYLGSVIALVHCIHWKHLKESQIPYIYTQFSTFCQHYSFKTLLFLSCVPGGMSFPSLTLLISSKVAHFPYKLFYSLVSCFLFRLLVSLSRSALRSLLSRPFPICSYRDHSRLRALTKNPSSSLSVLVRSPLPQEMNLSFHQWPF